MHCVRCKTDMKKNNLRGVLVDHCSNCDGIWLDEGELDALQQGMQKSPGEIRAEGREEMLDERRRGVEVLGRCPRCQKGQVQEKYMDGVMVDYCSVCKGIFFDHGELKQVLDNRGQGFFDRLRKTLFGA